MKRGPRTFAAIFEEAALRRELEELEKRMADSDFWKDQGAAQKVLQRRKRVEADLDLLKAANLDVYRFSASWARVMPEGRGAPNPEGLDFYDRLVDGMLERGLRPFATLYHWELPQPQADTRNLPRIRSSA